MENELAELFRKRRKHAPYFEVRGDKPGTELTVVLDWLSARYENPDDHFARLDHCANPLDPPDVIATDYQGGRHGFEVTEFVDREAAGKCDRDSKNFSEAELRQHISDRVLEKARAGFRDNTCISKCLIIYSDEPTIAFGDGLVFLSRLPTVAQSFFDEVWLMIPPSVNVSGREPQNPHCRIHRIPTS
jgi:hypothetical protein